MLQRFHHPLLDDCVRSVVGVGQLPGFKGAELTKAFAVRLGRSVELVSQTPGTHRSKIAERQMVMAQT